MSFGKCLFEISEFMETQHLQNEPREEIDFLYKYISKEITIRLKHIYWVCSEMRRYFQKYTQGNFKMRSLH